MSTTNGPWEHLDQNPIDAVPLALTFATEHLAVHLVRCNPNSVTGQRIIATAFPRNNMDAATLPLTCVFVRSDKYTGGGGIDYLSVGEHRDELAKELSRRYGPFLID